jgi:hypothetical protein
MNTPPEGWLELGRRDTQDARYDYASLRPKQGIELELTEEKLRQRHAAVQNAIAALRDVVLAAAPDAVVVFSNPHGGIAPDRPQPTFGIHLNDAPPLVEGVANQERRAPQAAPASTDGGSTQYPTDGALARELMDGLIEEGFDVAANFQSRPGAGLDGAFNLLYQKFDTDAKIPYVPVVISRYLPNQATPRRVYEFGQAVRRVLERSGTKRIAVMGSGGLSHQVIDEELDETVLDALQNGKPEVLCSLDRKRLNAAPGTPEILNWVACAGVMAPKTMTLIDYVPCYRSLAGTGHGNTFGYWK